MIRRGSWMALLGGVLWGFSGTCSQFLFTQTDVSVELLSSVRMILAGGILIFAGFLLQPRNMRGIWKEKKDVGRLLLFGLLGVILCQFAYLKAISYSNAGTATVLQYLAPVLIMGCLCVYRKRFPSGKEVLALVLALLGVFFLATHGDPGNLALSKEALGWGLAAAVGLALYSILPGSLIRKWGSFAVVGYGLLIAGIATGVLVRVWRYTMTWNAASILGILGVTVIGTVIAYTMYLQGVADIGADRASLLSCVEPVAATVFATLWLKTAFLPIDLIGFAAILCAVVLLSVGNLKPSDR